MPDQKPTTWLASQASHIRPPAASGNLALRSPIPPDIPSDDNGHFVFTDITWTRNNPTIKSSSKGATSFDEEGKNAITNSSCDNHNSCDSPPKKKSKTGDQRKKERKERKKAKKDKKKKEKEAKKAKSITKDHSGTNEKVAKDNRVAPNEKMVEEPPTALVHNNAAITGKANQIASTKENVVEESQTAADLNNAAIELDEDEARKLELQPFLASQVAAASSKAAQKEQEEATKEEKDKRLIEYMEKLREQNGTKKKAPRKKSTTKKSTTKKSTTKRNGSKGSTRAKATSKNNKNATIDKPDDVSSPPEPPNADNKEYLGCTQHKCDLHGLKELEASDTKIYTTPGQEMDLALLLQDSTCKGCDTKGENLTCILYYCQQCVSSFYDDEEPELSWYCAQCHKKKVDTEEEKKQSSSGGLRIGGRQRKKSARAQETY